ncbi:hypothetical protein [uncultured Roseobacter sp.]|uniref:type II toxin-antitoxin system HicB family antitoxin n=1 Tax=uncultured Roseobacter sp. TaxID=114847 RepID=UPI0026281FE4|nr:hypothetical protein [uncultured Roseobacter sp.]
MLHYPAIVFPADANGLIGVAVPDLLINASGETEYAALADAASIVEELLATLARDGEAFPEPSPSDEVELGNGVLAILSVCHGQAGAHDNETGPMEA